MARNGRRTGRADGQLPETEQGPARLTVVLTGRQEVRLALHRATPDTPASASVRVGRAQLAFTDPAAVGLVADRWSGMAGLATQLPTEWERTTPGASPRASDDAVAYRITDQTAVAGKGGAPSRSYLLVAAEGGSGPVQRP